jgi:calcineurin-like phosphoesterase family protein
MSNRFVVSDTHFGHTNSWEKFKKADGSPLRPFNSTEEMDEAMVERWNNIVSPSDTVYHLGDVVIDKKSLHHIKRLNGSKRLIRGNHDIFDDKMYYNVGFTKIVAYRVFVDEFVFSHIPLHPDCISDRFKCNVHGHTHSNIVTRTIVTEQGVEQKEVDPRYLCVCVEHTDFAPIPFEEVKSRIAKRWEQTGYVKPTSGWGNGSGPG